MNAPCRATRSLHGTFGWLWISVGGFLHSVTSLVSVPSTSVFHASSAACHLAITSIIIHILQLSSHCLRIQPLHPHRASGLPPCGLPKRPCCGRVWCVELLIRSKTTTASSFSAFWFQQGAVATSWVHCQWSYSWVGRILGLIIPTCLQRILLSRHGTWPTQEPPRRTVCNFTSLSFFDERYVLCRNLGLISTIFSKQFLTSTTLAMAMVASWYFFGSLHRPIPVRCNWSVFARKMHSTTEFAMTVLSKCVRVCVCVVGCGRQCASV